MGKNAVVNILRVFVDGKGNFGNPVGIVVDEKREIEMAIRQKITSNTGFSECVFINSLKSGNVNIFNPQEEDFAGYALVGTAYFINKIIGRPIKKLECRGGQILIRQERELTWIRAALAETPPWHHEQLLDESLVDSLSPAALKEHTIVWAWIDEGKGLVRARTFAPDWGIPEDEANGSGSLQLAAELGRRLEIHHGKGSVIYAAPLEDGWAEVGGRVEEDGVQEVVTEVALPAN